MPMVSMIMVWNIPWINPVVLCTSAQSERQSPQFSNYCKYESKAKLHGNMVF